MADTSPSSAEKTHIVPAAIFRSRYQICDDCECVTIVQRNDARGVPDEVDWDHFPGCMVCGGSMLHWDADEKAQDDIYWAKGARAGASGMGRRIKAILDGSDWSDRSAMELGLAINDALADVRSSPGTPTGGEN